jgi:hypothetical protein
MPNTLIVTVGSSPLPVVVSIMHLRPSIVHLVHTPDVVQVVRRICEHLKRKLPDCCPKLIEVQEHRSAVGIRKRLEAEEKLRGHWAECGLNYTGGTKLMAVHTHAFWSKNGGQAMNASYLGGNGRLYFDDPAIDPVREMDLPHLSLDELCSLHFGKKPHQQDDGHEDPMRCELAGRIRDFVYRHGHEEYRNLRKPIDHGGTVDLEPLFQDMDVKGLNVNAVDLESFGEWFVGKDYKHMEPKEKRKAQDDSRQWLIGGWLEVWFADQLARATTHDDQALFDEVHQDVEVGKDPDKFQMDVVAVRGYRVFLFSCTVDHTTQLVKSKFFEAANRTDRIGGEHARAAMVCLHEHPHEVLQTVQEEHWPGYDTLRLFGEPHVKGGAASCRVATGGDPPRDVTLLDGIRQWVAT